MNSGADTLLGLRGYLIDCPEYGRVRARSDGAVILEGTQIAEVGDYRELSNQPRSQPIRWMHSQRAAIFPGLIDLHTHLPQYPAVARGDCELLPWLRRHIFPLEREFKGARVGPEAAAFFAELARHGTTTAMVYSAIFEDSTEAAFHAALSSGLRVIMGKMMMDVGSYGNLQPTKVLSISLHESERLCRTWHGAGQGLIEYAVSPRFAVSCSEKMMRGAAELAARHGAYLQTHLAENLEEIEKVRHQFPSAQDYTDVYEQCGLLTERTVLGHCIHLSEREREALASRGARIAHCPTANLFLTSGVMPLDRMRAAGLHIGLGSDVGAGTELNLWQVMRSCIESQKVRAMCTEGVVIPTSGEVLYLATQGAAEALGKGSVIGTFEVGKEADITVMDLGSLIPYRQSKALHDLTPDDVLNLCIYRGGPHAVIETFVRGQSVFRAPEPELF
jgi:guanine deaminase